MKNVHNFAIFHRICLKLCLETLNVKTYSLSRVSDLLVIAILWNWWSSNPPPSRTQLLLRFFYWKFSCFPFFLRKSPKKPRRLFKSTQRPKHASTFFFPLNFSLSLSRLIPVHYRTKPGLFFGPVVWKIKGFPVLFIRNIKKVNGELIEISSNPRAFSLDLFIPPPRKCLTNLDAIYRSRFRKAQYSRRLNPRDANNNNDVDDNRACAISPLDLSLTTS